MTLTKKTSLALEAPDTHHHRRILFLSLEFNFSPFSGNGVLCRSLVSGLFELYNEHNDDVEIRVICAKPHPSTPNLSSDIPVTQKNLIIWPVQLQKSSSSQWKRLDRHGPWKEFATALCCQKDGSNHNNDINFRDCIEQFEPTDVVAVDWHGMLAWQAFCTTATNLGKTTRLWRTDQVNVCYYNFRVYSSSSWGNNDQDTSSRSSSVVGDNTVDENQFYKEMEQLSCRLADGIICLSEHDKCALHRLMMLQDNNDKDETNPTCCLGKQKKMQDITILPPPLRGDVCKLARMLDSQELPEQQQQEGISSSLFIKYLPEKAKKALEYVHQKQCASTIPQKRLFLTCVSRLSPEKSPHVFVNLIQQLGGVEFLRNHCLVPILCGAKSVDSYADEVIQSFQSVCSDDDSNWPCIVIDHHLGPNELAAIFSHTVLNVHPCLYDAYGMTMVESAAFGVPSIVNFGGKVGAAALLGENEGCVALDLSGMEGEMTTETIEGKNDSNEGQDCSAKKLKEILVSRIQHSTSPQWSRSCSTLAQVAKEARHRALGWDELSCCRDLIEKLNNLNNENEV
ncbi:hypothetical protein ACHAWT_000089 [Skeletonema menzelii]